MTMVHCRGRGGSIVLDRRHPREIGLSHRQQGFDGSQQSKRLLRQLLRRYIVRIQLRLLGFTINDIVGSVVVRLVEILGWLGAWRCAVHRVVSPENRPGEVAEANSAR